MSTSSPLWNDRFPRANQYHPDWIAAAASGGAPSLWLTEWLTEAMDLQAGQRVLDLARPLDPLVGFIQESALMGHLGKGLQAQPAHGDDQ